MDAERHDSLHLNQEPMSNTFDERQEVIDDLGLRSSLHTHYTQNNREIASTHEVVQKCNQRQISGVTPACLDTGAGWQNAFVQMIKRADRRH